MDVRRRKRRTRFVGPGQGEPTPPTAPAGVSPSATIPTPIDPGLLQASFLTGEQLAGRTMERRGFTEAEVAVIQADQQRYIRDNWDDLGIDYRLRLVGAPPQGSELTIEQAIELAKLGIFQGKDGRPLFRVLEPNQRLAKLGISQGNLDQVIAQRERESGLPFKIRRGIESAVRETALSFIPGTEASKLFSNDPLAPLLFLPGFQIGSIPLRVGFQTFAAGGAARTLAVSNKLRSSIGLFPRIPKITTPLLDALPDLRSAQTLISGEFTDDLFRRAAQRLENVPVLGGLVKGGGGQAAFIGKPEQKAIVMRAMWQEEGRGFSRLTMAHLDELGDVKDIFGPIDDVGRLTQGVNKGKFLDDIAAFPDKHTLTQRERSWIDRANAIDESKTQMLIQNGIDVKLLPLAEGEFFVGRRLFGKVIDGIDGPELLESAFVRSAGPGRPGAKAAFQKRRSLNDISLEEATDRGYRYLSRRETLDLNVNAAYKSVADQRMVDWFLEQVPNRTAAAPEAIKLEVMRLRAGAQRDRRQLEVYEKMLQASTGETKRFQGVVFKEVGRIDDIADKLFTAKLFGKTSQNIQGRLTEAKRHADFLARRYARAARRDERTYQNVIRTRDRLQGRLDDLDEILPQWQDDLERAQRQFLEGTINVPALQGRILTGPRAQEVASFMNNALNPTSGAFERALVPINKVNSVARYFVLAGDFSVQSIQLLFLAGAHPSIYAKAAGAGVHAMFNPQFLSNYYVRHAATIRSSPGMLLTSGGSTEVTQAMARGGLLRGGPAGKLLEPFQRFTETALDVAGIEMKEALQYMVRTPADNVAVDSFVNEFRGIISTARLGVSPTQRQIESATILASRYNRAIASLMIDVFRGGLRGQLARKSLMKGTMAVAAAFAAISAARGESLDEIAGHFQPMKKDNRGQWQFNRDFLTWDVAGQPIGVGSKAMSILGLLGRSIASPDDLRRHSIDDWMENPGLRFIRGNLAFLPETGIKLLTSRNYMGESIGDLTSLGGVLKFSERVVLEGLTPIALNSVITDGGSLTQRATRGVAERVGLRAQPQSAVAEFANYAEKAEQERVGGERVAFWEFDPDRQKFYKNVDKRGKALWAKKKEDDIKRDRVNRIVQKVEERRGGLLEELHAQAASVESGTKPHRWFIERYSDYGRDMAISSDQIRADFPRAAKELDDIPAPQQPGQLIYQRFMEIITDPSLDDVITGFDFRTRDKNIAKFRKEIGEDNWDMIVRTREAEATQTLLPKLAKDLIVDRDGMRHYWSIRDEEIDSRDLRTKFERYVNLRKEDQLPFLQNRDNWDLRAALLITDAKKQQYLITHPEVEQLLLKWEYRTQPLSPENIL